MKEKNPREVKQNAGKEKWRMKTSKTRRNTRSFLGVFCFVFFLRMKGTNSLHIRLWKGWFT